MQHCKSKSCALWVLCLLVLIAGGCRDGGVSESAEGGAGGRPVQESRPAASLGSELPSGSGEFDEGGDLVRRREVGAGSFTGETIDVADEESEEQTESASGDQEEPPALRSGEQQAADSAVDSVALGDSQSYHPEQVASEAGQVGEELALDDRTQDKVVRLVADSITLNDCVMRGEIRNYSDDQYARNVTVTVAALDGEESAQWHWPLTMKPGESAPFEMRIDWFPHVYDLDLAIYNGNGRGWKSFGNTSIDITADISSYPDIKRAFVIDYDATEPENIFQKGRHSYSVYDERALELELSKYWRWGHYAHALSQASKQIFATIFPDKLATSVDIEPTVAQFIPYNYADIYYLPSVVYPDIYKENKDDFISDVRVYQVYKQGSKVVDVWRLFPHLVVEPVDAQGLVIDRRFIRISDFINYNLPSSEVAYIRLLDPSYANLPHFPERNAEGWDATHREIFGLRPYEELYEELWVGGISHNSVTSAISILEDIPSSFGKACNASGSLSSSVFVLTLEEPIEKVSTYGYKGGFSGGLETLLSGVPENNSVEDIYVSFDSVTIDDHMIRGLIYNGSDTSFARGVTVSALIRETEVLLGVWQWPLSLQPGERAPFEIPYFESDLSIEQIVFQVSAELSELVDATRSFEISTYAYGTVYGHDFMELYESSRFDPYWEIRPDDYLHQYGLWKRPDSRYTKTAFLELYKGVIVPGDLEDLELFEFTDMYARLEPPDSHPELAKIVTNQVIGDLRAYTAILDREERVVDVKEVRLFTPVYGQANTNLSYLEVNTIPAPNRWSPNAVRLLLITPYEDETDLNEGHYFLVWIGGASEPVE